MKIRTATIQDIPTIMEIIEHAKGNLKMKGIDQWQNLYPNEEIIQNDIENSESYVYINENDMVVATVAVSFRGEETYHNIYEGQWLTNEAYAVVHRIAVHKNFEGKGVGTQLLKQIELLCEERGVNSIRIDTHSDNIPMQRSLEKLSYTKCGKIYLKDGSERLAYEKIIHNLKLSVLITGFDPFGGESTNPAYEAVKKLPDGIGEAELHKLELPTSFQRSFSILKEKIVQIEPDVVICVGQAGGRSTISVEKVGINYKDARIPDNDGEQPRDESINTKGKTAYFSNLPVNEIVDKIKEKGIPANLSFSAGTYVCNSILYQLMECIELEYPQMKGGFIHVPYVPSQVINKPFGTPSMSLDLTAKALYLAIETTIEQIQLSR